MCTSGMWTVLPEKRILLIKIHFCETTLILDTDMPPSVGDCWVIAADCRLIAEVCQPAPGSSVCVLLLIKYHYYTRWCRARWKLLSKQPHMVDINCNTSFLLFPPLSLYFSFKHLLGISSLQHQEHAITITHALEVN